MVILFKFLAEIQCLNLIIIGLLFNKKKRLSVSFTEKIIGSGEDIKSNHLFCFNERAK